MKHLIFFRSHYGHLIVFLEGLTEMIVTFSLGISYSQYTKQTLNIFHYTERNKNVKKVLM